MMEHDIDDDHDNDTSPEEVKQLRQSHHVEFAPRIASLHGHGEMQRLHFASIVAGPPDARLSGRVVGDIVDAV
jgi:hypothetical protein